MNVFDVPKEGLNSDSLFDRFPQRTSRAPSTAPIRCLLALCLPSAESNVRDGIRRNLCPLHPRVSQIHCSTCPTAAITHHVIPHHLSLCPHQPIHPCRCRCSARYKGHSRRRRGRPHRTLHHGQNCDPRDGISLPRQWRRRPHSRQCST